MMPLLTLFQFKCFETQRAMQMPEVKTLTAIATSSVGTVCFFPVPSHLKLSLDESAAKKRLNAIGASPVANRFVFVYLKEN